MITFVLYALSTILNAPVPGSVYWLTGLIDGLLFLPLLTLVVVPLAGRIGREKIGRLHYLQSVFPLRAVAFVLTPFGYEFAPVRDEEVLLADGTSFELDEDQTWYRLGNREFCVTYVPDKRVLNDVSVDADDIELETVVVQDEEGNQHQAYAIFGERGVLKKIRAGFRGWTPIIDTDDPPEGFIVSLSRTINSLRGGGGVRLSEHTERMTRMEHGGGSSLSNKARAYGFIGVILIASVFGTLIFGVL